MAKIKSPKIYDPYLGEMYGNILDQYDNPAYNLRLYLKPETVSGASSASPTGSNVTGTTPADLAAQGVNPNNIPAGSPLDPNLGASARSDTPSTPVSTTTTVSDKKIVVIAQTGVTGNQIDDLIIDAVPDNNAAAQLKAEFTVVQPGAANLLDQIQYARKYLGVPEEQLNAKDFKMFLDINFLGYNVDTVDDISKPDEMDAGGEPTQITDTVTYELIVRKISVKVDNTGSRYTFETTPVMAVGKNDEIYKLPKNITIIGSTITEFFKDLEAKYNKALVEQSTQYERADTVKFDVSALVGGAVGVSTSTGGSDDLRIKDETIPTQDTDQTVEGTTAPRYDNPGVKPAEEQRQDADGASKSGKGTEQTIPGVQLTLKEGDSLEKVIAQILSMNKEFQSYVTRMKGDLDDPGNTEVDEQKSFVVWFDVHCQVENGPWDKKRSRYTRTYTYTPFLVKDIRSDVALTTKEYDFLKEKGQAYGKERPVTALATKRLQDLYNAGVLHKSYFYIFTGLNDQIINLDISIDNAITLLMPPKGGMIGDFSVTSATKLSNSEPANKDLTQDDKLKAAKDAQNRESLIGLFNKIKGAADSIKGLAEAIGRTPDELAGILNDATGAASRKLAESLDSASIENLTKKLGNSDGSDPADTPTTSTEITVTNYGPYAPEVSGFLYSEDFVQPGGNLTSDEIEAAGLTVLDTKVPTDVGHSNPVTKSVPSPLSGITSTGPASVLMGYVYRSRGNEGANFLLNIELTLRGDPYWLTKINSGKFEYGKKDPDKTYYPSPRSKYYFLLTIGTPTKFDFNVDDEDANTGYWSDGRTSGYFSGLYMPLKWKNKFSGGIFTTEITATKEISVPLQWIRRVAPGETPPNYKELGAEGEEQNDFINQAALSRNTPTNSNDPSAPPIALEDLPALQLGGPKSQQAKAQAESFLGRPVTDREWELLVRATVGESGGGQSEDPAIAAVILNRARVNYGGYGTSIEDQLKARNQFQAVTGTANNGRQPNRGFAAPTQQQIGRATNNILTGLSSADKSWLNFTANNPAAYGPGTDIGFLYRARSNPTSKVIGGTIFFTDRGG